VSDATERAAAIAEKLAARILRFGPIGFDEFMEVALYDEHAGFYAAGGQAGRRGDFVTSVEVGPLFGAVVARALDEWWAELGEPDRFVVVEAGAGRGALAASIRAAAPRCASSLTYVLVERSAALRARHADHLPLTSPELALPPLSPDDDGGEVLAARGSGGRGPRFVSLAALPATRIRGVVLANELLDNLPCRLLERSDAGWGEVRIALTSGALPLTELVTPATEDAEAAAGRFAPAARPGSRIPLQDRATAWLRDALGMLEAGRVVVFDYGTTTGALAERDPDEWLRTYRRQERGGHVLADLGSQDITVEVCVDQLSRVRTPSAVESQADFLRRFGIEELVEEGRRLWIERAHIGDLEAVRARSRIGEAEALVDPAGLGGFLVMTWTVP
jgi:SAM-dependent MidA family methyltransferase